VYVRTLTLTQNRDTCDTRAVCMKMCQSNVRLSVLRKGCVRTPSQELTFPIGLFFTHLTLITNSQSGGRVQ